MSSGESPLFRRKSTAIEERARDALVAFLCRLHRRPLTRLLALYFPEGLPEGFNSPKSLRVETEVETNLSSRVDIMIAGMKNLLFVEVKVDAGEQVGQYEKYIHYFESRGYCVTAGGLINRSPAPRSRSHAPFFKALGVRRIFWSELLKDFGTYFAGLAEYELFRENLATISPAIGISKTGHLKENSLITTRVEALCAFYMRLLSRLDGVSGRVWQSGNSGYCLTFGLPSWAQKFQEPWYYRAYLCLETGTASTFKFSVMLWDRAKSSNISWFESHRSALVNYYTSRGFDVGRNEGRSWHRRVSWVAPYSLQGLRYANAFWNRRLPVKGNGELLTSPSLLRDCITNCLEFVSIIDSSVDRTMGARASA
jgi:hypothetical protein